MKRLMWFFAIIPLIVTSIVLQFMPDVIPMHHDLSGSTDRCIICAGLLTIITTVFANGIISTILMLVYLLIASVIAVMYSKKEFDNERKKGL